VGKIAGADDCACDDDGGDFADAVRHFLARRHKVPSRGTRRFSSETIFGELGVAQLRKVVV
jgi:hypothetical protein